MRAVRRAVIVLLACAAVLGAQDDPFDEPYDRWAVGIRFGFLFTDLMQVGSNDTVIDTDPFLLASEFSSAPKKRFFVGPSAQFNIKPRLGINVEFVTREVEFTREVSLRGADRFGNLEFISSESTRTRARYWDVPVQARFYFGDPGRPRAYVAAGGVFRFVTNLKANVDTVDAEGDEKTKNVDAEVSNKNPIGAIGSIGVQLTDDIGIKVEIEGRYTYWLDRAFAIGFSNSAQSQVEVAIGFSF